MSKHLILFTIVGLVFLFLTARTTPAAVVVFFDDFDTGASPTAGDDVDDPTDTAWLAATNHAVTSPYINTTNQLGSGNSLYGDITNSVNMMYTYFDTQTLSAAGSWLRVSFDYKYAAPASGVRTPSFGFYYGNGVAPSSADGQSGYLGRIDTDTSPGDVFFGQETGSDNFSLAGIDTGAFDVGGTIVITPEACVASSTKNVVTRIWSKE